VPHIYGCNFADDDELETPEAPQNSAIEDVDEETIQNAPCDEEPDGTPLQCTESIRVWKNRNSRISKADLPFTELRGPVQGIFDGCKTATDIFVTNLGGIVDHIVYQSNLYAVQKGHTLKLKREELISFIGVNFLMGYHQLPSIKHFWSTQPDLGVSVVQQTMSRNRFQEILRYLHLNDNSKITPQCKDKCFKLRPLIDSLNATFCSVYRGTREWSVDESMVLFKGRNSMKQYNPKKPIKRGYKIWAISDMNGYTKNFRIYQGKDEELEQQFNNYGLGERVVLNLTQNIWGKGYKIFFDNYFTSLRLLERLRSEKTLACGTMRVHRKGLPSLKGDKELKKGEFDFSHTSTGLGVYKWKDTKCVLLASNYHGSEVTTVKRTDRTGRKTDVPCPAIIKCYNDNMGGVDKADQLRTLYAVNRKANKWWHRLFWALMDMSFVNSYVIYCEVMEKIPLLEFRREVTLGMMGMSCERQMASPNSSRISQSRKRSSPVAQTICLAKKKTTRPPGKYSVPKDVRLTGQGVHWPVHDAERGRCELCSLSKIQSKPYTKCSHCGVYLCLNSSRNCFQDYHT
jgi:hypothetical protein